MVENRAIHNYRYLTVAIGSFGCKYSTGSIFFFQELSTYTVQAPDRQKASKATKMNSTVRIAIFASGAGSNAQKIIEHFADGHAHIKVALVVCNKSGAGVINLAQQAGIPLMIVERTRFFSPKSYIPELQEAQIDFIVLAGFLWKIPDPLIKAWPQKIVNIHPALLPKYGGKGMYGHFVHEAVLAAGDAESGITIHYVDELYDHGRHLFQARCPVLPGDTPETLAKRVLTLEHQHFAEVVEKAIRKSLLIDDSEK